MCPSKSFSARNNYRPAGSLEAALREYANPQHWGISRDDLDHRVVSWIGPGAEKMPTPDRQARTAAQGRREWSDDDWITCPRCEGQKYDHGSCGLCGNLGALDENGERFHCDCRADDWVEGDNGAIRCETCGGYAGEPGTSIRVVAVDA